MSTPQPNIFNFVSRDDAPPPRPLAATTTTPQAMSEGPGTILECSLEAMVFPNGPPDCTDGIERRYTIQLTGVGSPASTAAPLLQSPSYFCEGSSDGSITSIMEAMEESPLVVAFVRDGITLQRSVEERDRTVTFTQQDADVLVSEVAGPTYGWAFLCEDRKELNLPKTTSKHVSAVGGTAAHRRLLILDDSSSPPSPLAHLQAHVMVYGGPEGSRLFSSNPFTVDVHELLVVEKVLGFKLYTRGFDDGDGPTLSLTISVPTVSALPSGVVFPSPTSNTTTSPTTTALTLNESDLPIYSSCRRALKTRLEDYLDAISPQTLPHATKIMDDQLLPRPSPQPTASYPTGAGTDVVQIYSGSTTFLTSSGPEGPGVRELIPFTKLRKRFGMTCFGARLHSMLLWYHVVYVLQANSSKYFSAPPTSIPTQDGPLHAVSAAAATTTVVRLLLPPTGTSQTTGSSRQSVEEKLLHFLRKCSSGTGTHTKPHDHHSPTPGVSLSNFHSRTKELTELLLDLWDNIEGLLMARLSCVFGPEPFLVSMCGSLPNPQHPQLASRDWQLWGTSLAALHQTLEFGDSGNADQTVVEGKLKLLRDVAAHMHSRDSPIEFLQLLRSVGSTNNSLSPPPLDVLADKARDYVIQERQRADELRACSWWTTGQVDASKVNAADYDPSNEFAIPKVLQLKHEMNLHTQGPYYEQEGEVRRVERLHHRLAKLSESGRTIAELLVHPVGSTEFEQILRADQHKLSSTVAVLQPHFPQRGDTSVSSSYPEKSFLPDSSLAISRVVLRRVFQPNPLTLNTQRGRSPIRDSFLADLLTTSEGRERAALQLVFTDAFAGVADTYLPVEAALTLALLKLLHKKAISTSLFRDRFDTDDTIDDSVATKTTASTPGAHLWLSIETNLKALVDRQRQEEAANRRRQSVLATLGDNAVLASSPQHHPSQSPQATAVVAPTKLGALKVHADELERKRQQRLGGGNEATHTQSSSQVSTVQSSRRTSSAHPDEFPQLSSSSLAASSISAPEDSSSPFHHLSHTLLITPSSVLIPLSTQARRRWEGDVYGYFLHRKWLLDHTTGSSSLNNSSAVFTPFPRLLSGYEVAPDAAEERFRSALISAFDAANTKRNGPSSRRSSTVSQPPNNGGGVGEEITVHRFVIVVPHSEEIQLDNKGAHSEASVVEAVQNGFERWLHHNSSKDDRQEHREGWMFSVTPECPWPQLQPDSHDDSHLPLQKKLIFSPLDAETTEVLSNSLLVSTDSSAERHIPTRCPPTVGAMIPPLISLSRSSSTTHHRKSSSKTSSGEPPVDACQVEPADFHFLCGYERAIAPPKRKGTITAHPTGTVIVYAAPPPSPSVATSTMSSPSPARRALVLVVDAIVSVSGQDDSGCHQPAFRMLAYHPPNQHQYNGTAATTNSHQSILLKAVFTAEIGAATQLTFSSADLLRQSLPYIAPTVVLPHQSEGRIVVPRSSLLKAPTTHTATESIGSFWVGHSAATKVAGLPQKSADVSPSSMGGRGVSPVSNSTPTRNREPLSLGAGQKNSRPHHHNPSSVSPQPTPHRDSISASITPSDVIVSSPQPKKALSLDRRRKLGKLASLFQFMDDADQFVDDGDSEEDVLVEVTADFDDDPYLTGGNGTSQSAPSKSSFLRRSTIGSRFTKEPDGKPPAEDTVHPSGVSRQLREFELQQHDLATRGTPTRNASTMSVAGRGAGKQQFETQPPASATPRSRSIATASTNMSRATTTTTTVVKSVRGIERFRKDPYAGVVLQRRPRGSTPHAQSVTTVDDLSPSNHRSKLITRGDVLATCGEDIHQQQRGGDRNGSPISVYSAASTSASHHIKRNAAFPVRATAVLGATTHPSQDVLPITYQEERMLVRAAYHNQKDKKLMRGASAASTSVAAADADASSSFIIPDVDGSMHSDHQPIYTTLTYASMGGERGDTGVVDDGDDEDFPLWLKDGGLVPTSALPIRASRSHSARTGSKAAFKATSAFGKAASGLFGNDDSEEEDFDGEEGSEERGVGSPLSGPDYYLASPIDNNSSRRQRHHPNADGDDSQSSLDLIAGDGGAAYASRLDALSAIRPYESKKDAPTQRGGGGEGHLFEELSSYQTWKNTSEQQPRPVSDRYAPAQFRASNINTADNSVNGTPTAEERRIAQLLNDELATSPQELEVIGLAATRATASVSPAPNQQQGDVDWAGEFRKQQQPNPHHQSKYVVIAPDYEDDIGHDDELDEHGVPYRLYNEMGRSPSSVAAGHYSRGAASRLHSNAQSQKLAMPRSPATYNEQLESRSVGMRPQGKGKPQGTELRTDVLEPITTSRGHQLDSFGAVIDRSVAARSEERVFEEKGAAADDIFAHVDSASSSQVGGGQRDTYRQRSNIRDDLVHWANPVSPQLASNQRRATSPDPRSASYSSHQQGRGSPSHSAAPSDIFASATVVRQQQHFGGSTSGANNNSRGAGGGGSRWDVSRGDGGDSNTIPPLKLSSQAKEEVAAYHKVLTGWELMHDHNAHKALQLWSDVATTYNRDNATTFNSDGSRTWNESVGRGSSTRGVLGAYGSATSATTKRPIPNSLVALEAFSLLLEHQEVDMNAAVQSYAHYIVEIFDVLLSFMKAGIDDGTSECSQAAYTTCAGLITQLREEMAVAMGVSDSVTMMVETPDPATPVPPNSQEVPQAVREAAAKRKHHIALSRFRYPPRTYVKLLHFLWIASPKLFSHFFTAGLLMGSGAVPPVDVNPQQQRSHHYQQCRYLSLMLQQGVARSFFNIANLLEKEYQDGHQALYSFGEAHRYGEVLRAPERMVRIQRQLSHRK